MNLHRHTAPHGSKNWLALALLPCLMLVLTACNTGPHSSTENVRFSIDSSHDQIYVGETITVWANTANVIGEQPEVNWTTSGGDLTEKNNGSVAQITFDEPGTYEVAGRLKLSNGVDRMDRVTVRVSQLP